MLILRNYREKNKNVVFIKYYKKNWLLGESDQLQKRARCRDTDNSFQEGRPFTCLGRLSTCSLFDPQQVGRRNKPEGCYS